MIADKRGKSRWDHIRRVKSSFTPATPGSLAGEVFGGATVAVYKDGEFYGILAAYETEILTEENIKSIANYYEEYTYAVTNREPNSK